MNTRKKYPKEFKLNRLCAILSDTCWKAGHNPDKLDITTSGCQCDLNTLTGYLFDEKSCKPSFNTVWPTKGL